MIYRKDCNVTMDCWSEDGFFNKKKKSSDMLLKLELNKAHERNSYSEQLVMLSIGEEKIRINVSELVNAINLLKDVHNAGR